MAKRRTPKKRTATQAPASTPTDNDFRQRIEKKLRGYDPAAGVIDLSRCGIDEQSISWVVSGVRALKGLVTLRIQENKIGDDGAISIATNLGKLSELDVSSNFISGRGAVAITKSLAGLKTLKIGDNKIGKTGASAMATHLRKLKKLRTLAIWNNSIGNAGVTALSESLAAVTELDISWNAIDRKGAATIARNIPQLRVLNIGSNPLNQAGTVAIANGLRKLTSLRIGGCGIADEGMAAIASHLGSLRKLDASNNAIANADAIVAFLKKSVRQQGTGGLQVIDITANPLCWPGTGDALSHAVQSETDAKRLLELLLRESTGIAAAGLAFIGRTMHGKTHAARWVVAREKDFASLRVPIPRDQRTWGYDRYSMTLLPDQHQHPELPDLWLTVVDVGGQREQLNSVCNLVYINAWRSVFVLVVKASESFKHGNWADYYLKLIESLGLQKRVIEDGQPCDRDDLTQSPAGPQRIPVILLVSHGKGERNIKLPEPSEFEASYPLLDVLVFDPWEALEGDDYLPALHQAIGKQVAKVNRVRERVVSTTLTIKDELVRQFELDQGFPDRVPPRINSMRVDEFREMCQLLDETSEAVQDLTIRELGALGFLTVVGGTKRLRPGTRLLNPRFINHYLFAGILEQGSSKLKDGFMSNKWFDVLTHDIKDPLEIEDLKTLMRDCLITFDWKHSGYRTGQFVPDLLRLRPGAKQSAPQKVQCRVKLKPKEFMNESAFFNFVAERKSELKPVHVERRHDGSERISLLLRNQCVMRNGKCEAWVTVDVIEQEITIEVIGPDYATAWAYGEGLRYVLREKVGGELEGQWELGVFRTIVQSLRQPDQTCKRACEIIRYIAEKMAEARQRHTWSGHIMGEWLADSPGSMTVDSVHSETNWALAKRAIAKLLDLQLIEGTEQRLPAHRAHRASIHPMGQGESLL